jgi:hypothetical protein
MPASFNLPVTAAGSPAAELAEVVMERKISPNSESKRQHR